MTYTTRLGTPEEEYAPTVHLTGDVAVDNDGETTVSGNSQCPTTPDDDVPRSQTEWWDHSSAPMCDEHLAQWWAVEVERVAALPDIEQRLADITDSSIDSGNRVVQRAHEESDPSIPYGLAPLTFVEVTSAVEKFFGKQHRQKALNILLNAIIADACPVHLSWHEANALRMPWVAIAHDTRTASEDD